MTRAYCQWKRKTSKQWLSQNTAQTVCKHRKGR